MLKLITFLTLLLVLSNSFIGQSNLIGQDAISTNGDLNYKFYNKTTLNSNTKTQNLNVSRRTGIYQTGYTKKVKKLYRSKYFLTESAFMPDPGQIYFENKLYVIIGAGMGITNFFSVELNAFINTLGLPPLIPNVSLKLGHSFNDYIHASIKYNLSGDTENDDFYKNYLSGFITLGKPEMNLTLGYNRLGLIDTRNTGNESFLNTISGLSIAASVDVFKRSNFKIEHLYFPKEGGYIAAGFGSSWEHFSFNYGVALPVTSTSTILEYTTAEYFGEAPLPYLSFIVAIADVFK